jgi:hypothetical protein
MKNSLIYTLFIAGITALLITCKSDVAPETGSLKLQFSNVAGLQPLSLNTGQYTNGVAEALTISKFNYFVSNFRLLRADGSEYIVPTDNNYFLIQTDKPASQSAVLANIPAGRYIGLSFMVGVDSLRSTMDISKRTGVLDPGAPGHDGMYWEWNSGYIFMKLEGSSAASATGQFLYHVGGFGGGFFDKKTINNLRTATLSFGSDAATVSASDSPTVFVVADALKVLSGVRTVSIAQNPSVMFEPYSASIADNYARMFRYSKIQMN